MADTGHNGIDILQHRGVLHTTDIAAAGGTHKVVREDRGEGPCAVEVFAGQREVREAPEGHLLSVARPGDDGQSIQRHLVTLGQIVRDEHVLVRHEALDGREDCLVAQGHAQLLQVVLEEGRWGGEDEQVGAVDDLVNVGREMDALRVERHGGEVRGVVLRLLELLDDLLPTYVPIHLRLVREHDLGQRCGPASAAHDGNLSGEIFHVDLVLFTGYGGVTPRPACESTPRRLPARVVRVRGHISYSNRRGRGGAVARWRLPACQP